MIARHQIVLRTTQCWFFYLYIYIYSPDKKKNDTQSHAMYSTTFTRVNSPFFRWQFSCRYPKKRRVVFLDFFVDKLRQLREFNTWKISTSLKPEKKCVYIVPYSFLLLTTIRDLSGKILLQLRNSQLTISRNVHLTTFNVTDS